MSVVRHLPSLPSITTECAPASGQTAFAQLYTTYFELIYRYCWRRLGDALAAEDATSTVFARALAAGPRYHDPALRSWLFAIAHNVIANTRRGTRQLISLETADGHLDLLDPGPAPDDLLLAGEERTLLLGALQTLPAEQRQVVLLRMSGLTGPEIAQEIGRSHGAVKMLQLRAFTTLRARLAPPQEQKVSDLHG